MIILALVPFVRRSARPVTTISKVVASPVVNTVSSTSCVPADISVTGAPTGFPPTSAIIPPNAERRAVDKIAVTLYVPAALILNMVPA